MALTLSISSPVFNLVTGKLVITDTSAGTPALTKGVFRILAPDEQYYYSAGNDADTFADPSTATSPDITAIGGICSTIDIPTDVSGNPQIGAYEVDYNAYDGVSTYNMEMLPIGYSFVAPTVVINLEINCVTAKLTSSDDTNYTVDFITPTITRSHTLEKDNDEPASYSYSGNQADIILSSPYLYAGGYTTTLSSDVVYEFENHDVSTTLTGTATFDAQCERGICSLYCGIKTLEMNLEDAKSSGNTIRYEELKEKLQLISAYVVLFTQAVKCGDETGASNWLTKIQEVGEFSDNCCTGDDNYPINPFLDGHALVTQHEGANLSIDTSVINFTGPGVTSATSEEGTVTLTFGDPEGVGITVKDEGTIIKSGATSIDFVGANVTVDLNGDQPRVTIEDSGATGDGLYGYNIDTGTTATDIEGVPVGTTFPEGTLLKDVVYQILNPYKDPYFSSFTSSLFTSYEVGQAMASGSQSVSYSVAYPANIKPQPPNVGVPSTTLSGATFPVNPFSLSASGSFNITIASSTYLTTPGSRTISLQGTNSKNSNFSTVGYASWLYRVFYGNSSNVTLTESQIEALSNSGLASGFATTYGLSGSSYKYICFPDAFGSPSQFKDAGTGLNVAMATSTSDAFYSNVQNGFYYGIVSVTNAYGITANYRVYRTYNEIVALNITVS